MNGGRAHHDMVSKSNASHFSLPHSILVTESLGWMANYLIRFQWGLCVSKWHTILGGSPVILLISELGGKPKWLPLKFGYHDVMRTSPISRMAAMDSQ